MNIIKEKLFDLAYIEDVSVRRSWPDTIIISVNEKSEVGELLKSALDFDVADFNRKIILPKHTRTVLEEVSTYLNPESKEKTLMK